VRKNEPQRLTGRKKAAILMLAIGPESAADVYRNLSDQEIEQITMEIANVGRIAPEAQAQVIEEFYHTAMAKQYINHGGISTAREILERALGPGKAVEVIERLQGMLAGNPFDFLKHVDSSQLLSFVSNEHPQTIALILSHISHEQAAAIMAALDGDTQREVALRIATMDTTSPEIVNEVERILEKKLATLLSQEYTKSGGVDTLAELLNRIDQNTGKNILQSMESDNQELAHEIKKQMFTFDDMVRLDDRTIQVVLRHIDQKALAAALKGATEEVKSQFFHNMSSRAADILKDDIDTMGPVRVKQVEESQQSIIALLRQLEENGEIQISRSNDDPMIM